MVLQLLPLLMVLGAQAPPQQPVPPAPAQKAAPAPRKTYNETADARAQIAAAINGVKSDGTRVLVVWGTNDDANCTGFQRAFAGGAEPKKMRDMLSDEYRVVYVDVGHLDRNQDVARSYDARLAAGALPHLTVLDVSGKVVARASSAEFAAPAGASEPFDPAKLLAFMAKHQAPAPPPAGPLYKAALEKGKREGKTIFVWFSAPW